MKKKILLIGFFIIMLLGGWQLILAVARERNVSTISAPQIQLPVSPDIKNADLQGPSDQPDNSAPKLSNTIAKEIKEDVPFVVQAPFKNWDDPIFQNACEEASIVMAMGWINGVKSLSPAEAKKQILDIVGFEDKNFGYNTDTDVFDVEKIFKNFFKYEDVSVGEGIDLDDIKEALQQGNIVIIPAFGQELENPYYVAPGPVAHMLVITGYDPATKEFITNDPGTQRGKDYRYKEDVLFYAIWSYPSGQNVPMIPSKILKKAMIVIRK